MISEKAQNKIKEVAEILDWQYYYIETRYYEGKLIEITISKEG